MLVHPKIKEICQKLSIDNFKTKEEYFKIKMQNAKKKFPYSPDWSLINGDTCTEIHFIFDNIDIDIDLRYKHNFSDGYIYTTILYMNGIPVPLNFFEKRLLKKRVMRILKKRDDEKYKRERSLLSDE